MSERNLATDAPSVSGNAVSGPVVVFAVPVALGGSLDTAVFGSEGAPYDLRLLDASMEVTTAALATTALLRTAAGGVGSAASASIVTATTGRRFENMGAGTVTSAVDRGSALYVRRSANTIAGTVFVRAMRILP